MLTQRNILDHNKCVGNRLVQQIEADNPQLKQYIVCNKCFKKIQNKNIVHCNSCGRTDTRRKMVINRNKGDIAVTHSMCRSSSTVPHTNGYICTVCSHKTCKTRKCLCCLHHVPSTNVSVYCNTDYDFSLYVVYTLLYNCTVSSCETNQNEHFICNVCKATLITATHKSQHVSRFVKHPIARAGANFLNTLQDKPECICTVCHQLLFWKSVRVFDVANYNISNAIVNKCLSFRHTTQVGCSTNEFICFHCKTC